MSDWHDNHGGQPAATKGKRMAVELFNGAFDGLAPYSPTAPIGWTADDADWCISDPPKPYQIKRYKLH